MQRSIRFEHIPTNDWKIHYYVIYCTWSEQLVWSKTSYSFILLHSKHQLPLRQALLNRLLCCCFFVFPIVPSQLLFLWGLLDVFSTAPSVIFILGHFHSINSTVAHSEATGRDQSSHRRTVTQSHRPFSPFASLSYWLLRRAACTGPTQRREHISKVAFRSIMLSAGGVFGVLRGC